MSLSCETCRLLDPEIKIANLKFCNKQLCTKRHFLNLFTVRQKRFIVSNPIERLWTSSVAEPKFNLRGTDLRRGDSGLGAADGAGQDGAGLVVARQDLGDTAVRHAQLSADVAWPGGKELCYNSHKR